MECCSAGRWAISGRRKDGRGGRRSVSRAPRSAASLGVVGFLDDNVVGDRFAEGRDEAAGPLSYLSSEVKSGWPSMTST